MQPMSAVRDLHAPAARRAPLFRLTIVVSCLLQQPAESPYVRAQILGPALCLLPPQFRRGFSDFVAAALKFSIFTSLMRGPWEPRCAVARRAMRSRSPLQCPAENARRQTATGLSLIGLLSCVRRRCVHRLVRLLPAPQGHVLLRPHSLLPQRLHLRCRRWHAQQGQGVRCLGCEDRVDAHRPQGQRRLRRQHVAVLR